MTPCGRTVWEGRREADLANTLAVSINTVSLWSSRFEKDGLAGLRDAPRRGRKPSRSPEKVNRVLTTVTQPPRGSIRWVTRTLAARPWDIVGLFMSPPDKTLVLYCDEKSQCQALERAQPGLPLGIGHIRTRTHDYKRHGAITLFAALNHLEGKLVSRTEPTRNGSGSATKFTARRPKDLAVHVIADNCATLKHATVTQWLNLVERYFADSSRDCIRDGSFQSVGELVLAVEEFLAVRRVNPKCYVWKANGEEILRKVAKARATLATVNAI